MIAAPSKSASDAPVSPTAPTELPPSPKVDAAPIAEPPSYIPGEPLAMNNPLRAPAGIVRGGTTSRAYDLEMQQRMSEADERRAQDEAERHLGNVPIEQGGALNFERKLADPLESPRVLLAYVAWGKEIVHEQLCELVFDDTQVPPTNILIFVCPECHRRGVPSQFAQMHVRDNHRTWAIDDRGAGEVKAVKNDAVAGGMEFFTFAGYIMDTDTLGCDNVNCGAKFKINKNRLYRVK